MPETPPRGHQRPRDHQGAPGGRLAIGAAVALAVCCVGHTLLLVSGVAGAGALAGVISGRGAWLAAAGAVLAVTGVLIASRLRRRPASTSHPGRSAEGERLQPSGTTTCKAGTDHPAQTGEPDE